MTAYGAELGAPTEPEHPEIPYPEQPEEPQQVQIPADMRAPAPAVLSIEPIPEVAPSAPPAAPRTPPVIPSISEPPPSFEPRIAISISKYRGADYRHSDPAYYHLEADSTPSGYSIDS
ncbi:predicted GPI-anchored protein 58 [Vitis riparia]|uniref:predicted GPI-anchored protein 58 n=1 Tax=Vitis riparia TaxID=96939 RepID=UPI00155AFEAC|nr:predicted GPI-anchored protein 58 [Vitis riparia]